MCTCSLAAKLIIDLHRSLTAAAIVMVVPFVMNVVFNDYIMQVEALKNILHRLFRGKYFVGSYRIIAKFQPPVLRSCTGKSFVPICPDTITISYVLEQVLIILS